MVGMRVCRRWGEMLRACSASMRGGGFRVVSQEQIQWCGLVQIWLAGGLLLKLIILFFLLNLLENISIDLCHIVEYIYSLLGPWCILTG